MGPPFANDFIDGVKRSEIICLFDVDGTLTLPRQRINAEMEYFMDNLKRHVTVGLVGGSDLDKIAEQMAGSDPQVPNTDGPVSYSQHAANIHRLVNKFDYVFAENGLVAYHSGKLIGRESILTYMGEKKLQRFINFCLSYMSELDLPAKRGNFIEFRNGLINVCPVGRSCSQAEREQFAEYDRIHKIREKFVAALNEHFGSQGNGEGGDVEDMGLRYVIGGQISFDAFPIGWDKTYCLRYLPNFKKIYFFGDRTMPGGNDHEIFAHEKTIGYQVNTPEHTRAIVSQLFFKSKQQLSQND